jgi:hypothetical protein
LEKSPLVTGGTAFAERGGLSERIVGPDALTKIQMCDVIDYENPK